MREGAKVLASDRSADGRDAIAATERAHPDRVHYVAADVTRTADLDRIVAAAVDAGADKAAELAAAGKDA